MAATDHDDPYMPHYATTFDVPPLAVNHVSISADERRHHGYVGEIAVTTNLGVIRSRCTHVHRTPEAGLKCARTLAQRRFGAKF